MLNQVIVLKLTKPIEMTMKRLLCILQLLLIANVTQADPRSVDNTGFTRVVTRLVKLLTEQEHALIAATATGESEKINPFLMEDFEERNAAVPATPIPKVEWLEATLKQRSSDSNVQIEQASAHEFGELVAFSFISTDKTINTNAFIVDLWKLQTDGGWKLAVRYRAPVDIHQQPTVLKK